MPEFRFRRKKQNRRKTVHDAEEAAKQIEAAKNLEKPVLPEKRASLGGPPSKGGVVKEQAEKPVKKERNSLVQEREKFLELLRSKYPEQASNLDIMANGEGEPVMTNGHAPELDQPIRLEDSNDIIKAASASDLTSYNKDEETTVASTYGECLFLRCGKSVRHCPMPSPITLSTVKNLYRNLFDLGDDLLNHPDSTLYVRERGVREWQRLDKISMVVDHCTLLLLEPGHTLGHTPSPPLDSDINTPLDLSSSTHATQESRGSQPHSSGQDKETTPITVPKLNGLWKGGRTKEVEDLTRLSDSHPIHKTSMSSPLSLTSSTSGVYSEPLIDPKKVSDRARLLQATVSNMKSEMKKLRSDHCSKMADFSLTMTQMSNQISAALRAFMKVGGVSGGGEEFRRERIELYRDEESYLKLSGKTFSELKLLDTTVENMRVDVVDRRCGVAEQEVDALVHAVSTVTKAVTQLQAEYGPLESKMKRVMEGELQTVVREEKFIQEEGPRVTEAVDTCTKLEQTLGVLTQFASVQSHRTPLVPFYPVVNKPDREALLENIQAVIPNHAHRVECLNRAEEILKKKKALHSPLKQKLKEFEAHLRIQRDHLRHIEINTIEKRRQMKLKANFMEERYKMEKEIEKELEAERKLAVQKREQRKKQMEELWKWQQRAKVEDEKMRQKKSIQQLMAGVSSSSGSNRSIPTSDGSGHDSSRGGRAPLHTRASSDDQSQHISLSQSNEPAPPVTQLMPAPKGKRFRKKDHLQPWQRKSIGYVSEFENLYQTISDAVKTNQNQSHPLTTSKQQPTNQISATKSPTSQVTVVSVTSNQTAPARSYDKLANPPLTAPKPKLGPRVEVKEVTSNPRQHQFQTTPPFKHPSKQSNSTRPTKTVGQIRSSNPTTKSSGLPSRYILDHGSQPDTDSLHTIASMPTTKAHMGYKTSGNCLSQPTEDSPLRSHMQPMLLYPDTHAKRSTIGSTRMRSGADYAPNMPIKRANSDDSLYESSTLERRKKQGLTNAPYKVKHHGDVSPSQNRKWAMNMMNKDTLPVEYRNHHGNQMHAHNSSGSSGSSSQGAKVRGQSSSRYPQQGYNMQATRTRSDIPPHRHAPNCPAHGHHAHSHAHQGVPMRVTRSAQVPKEGSLTSYPRHLASAAHTFQMRSASNGVVQHHAHRGGRVTHYPGHVTSGVSHVTNRRMDDQAGSLV